MPRSLSFVDRLGGDDDDDGVECRSEVYEQHSHIGDVSVNVGDGVLHTPVLAFGRLEGSPGRVVDRCGGDEGPASQSTLRRWR